MYEVGEKVAAHESVWGAPGWSLNSTTRLQIWADLCSTLAPGRRPLGLRESEHSSQFRARCFCVEGVIAMA